ncbi:MAG: alpha/beta fold hydrolase [Ramlibacter sp.]
MPAAHPFVRAAGSGPGVVCLHANASSSSQWRGLMDLLAPRFHVLAPDSYGAGKSPEWPSDRRIALQDEVDLLAPVLADAGAPVVLVGHSYGAAIALVAALANPGRVRALALYEPTLFSLLDAEHSPPNEADGIKNAVAASVAALERGDRDGAAQAFIDYWMGAGSWQATPEARRGPIAASVVNVRRWAHALTTEPAPLAAFRDLQVPILYMLGGRSTTSAHGVARLLTATLPQVEVLTFPNLGHMGPVTDPGPVNDAIVRFLEQQP